MQIRRLLVGVGLALMACKSDSTTAPIVVASGSLSFSYTGAGGAATYSASGSAPASRTSSYGTAPWAAGTSDAATQIIDAIAVVPKTSTTWDFAVVSIGRLTVGSSTINSSCTATQCTGVTIAFGTTQNSTSFQFVCSLASGTVAITSVSSTRVVGTFSGSGTCVTLTGASSAFTVTNGSFDVPLVT